MLLSLLGAITWPRSEQALEYVLATGDRGCTGTEDAGMRRAGQSSAFCFMLMTLLPSLRRAVPRARGVMLPLCDQRPARYETQI